MNESRDRAGWSMRPRSTVCALLLASVLVPLAATGAPGADGGGATSARDADNEGAERIARRLPRVGYRGGPFLRHPRVVTITFLADDAAIVASLERFGDAVTRASWWDVVRAGYCAAPDDCIGRGRPGRAVRLEEALPSFVHASDLEAILRSAAQAGRLGPLDPDTLLLVYLPAGVELGDARHPRYCRGGARALHRALRLPDLTVPFGVVPRCGPLDEITAAASHETLEATTNPDPARPGFAFARDPEWAAFLASGAEPVDPCGLVTMDRHRARVDGFVVQRAWSNEAAAHGRDPCVPSPTDRPYLALVPDAPVIRLPAVGDTATIAVRAAADRPASSWRAEAIDLSGRQDGVTYLDAAFDVATAAPGGVLQLTVTARRIHPDETALVGLVSTHGAESYVWPLLVVMR